MDPTAPPTQSEAPSPVAIIGAEDEDFENDLDPTPEGGRSSPFSSLEQLRQHPAYLMAFLHHVLLQFDPCPVLFCLHLALLRDLGPREGKKQLQELGTLFLGKGALLRVPIPPHLQLQLERSRPELLPEPLLQELEATQSPEVARQLQDFRWKRLLGMTPGEQELGELEAIRSRACGVRQAKERQLAQRLLAKLGDLPTTISGDQEKSSAVLGAVVSLLKALGVQPSPPLPDPRRPKAPSFLKKISGSRRGFPLPGGLWPRDPPAEKPPPSKSEGGSQRLRGAAGGAAPPSSGTPDPSPGVCRAPPPGEGPSPEPRDPLDPPPREQLEEGAAESQGPDSGGSGGPGGPCPPPPAGPQPPPQEPEEDPDPPCWRDLAPPQLLGALSKREIRRQEGINELLQTEQAHVRTLRVLLELFQQPMLQGGFFSHEELAHIFPGLEDLVEAHALFLQSLKRLREESGAVIPCLGPALLARFTGDEGLWFRKLSGRFCSRQPLALQQLSSKGQRDPRFRLFVQEAESRPRCRRLRLRDLIPAEMQRLTKYPLLLAGIARCSEEGLERDQVEKAAESCREILDHVNCEARGMESFMKLLDYQRRLDLPSLRQSTDPLISRFKSTALTQHRLLHEGPLTWRVTRDKAVEVQALLLEELLVLLQRLEGGRLALREGGGGGRPPLSPLVPLRGAMTRPVATDPRAFYLLSSWQSCPRIHQLLAPSAQLQRTWTALISQAAEALQLPPRAPAGGPCPPSPPCSHQEEEEAGGAPEEPPQEQQQQQQQPGVPGSGLGPPQGLAEQGLRRVSLLKQLLLPEPGKEGGPGGVPAAGGALGGPGSGDGAPSPPEGPTPPQREQRETGDGAETPEGGAAGWGSQLPPPAPSSWLREELGGLEETLRGLKEIEERFWGLQRGDPEA